MEFVSFFAANKKKMNYRKISLAALFLVFGNYYYAQITKTDSIKNKDEKNIEGVILKGKNFNKKSETAILAEQKKSIIQKQSMGTEEISRKGISNVEQGLAKITGITTVEGKGLFVRGLEERYNTLLINNLGSPSNNPFQKIIALKQFPTDVVGKLNIYKTFNSNLYADFAGATFDIETATFEKALSKVEFSIGVNTLSTFRNNFKTNEHANTINGYFGLNSKDRALPSPIKDYRPSNYHFTQEESINNFKDNWNVDNVKSLPNTSIGFTTAQKFKVGKETSAGFLFSMNHGNQYEYREGAKNQFINLGNDIVLNNDLLRKQYVYEMESSVLLGFGLKNSTTNVNLNAIFLQNSSNMIEDYFGYKNHQVQDKEIGFFRVNQLDISKFLDLQLSALQKFGERHLLKAGGSWVINNYQQPDRKILEGTRTSSDDFIQMNYGGNNLLRQYFDVKGNKYFSTYAEYSVGLGKKLEENFYPIQLAIGYNGYVDIRNTSYRFISSDIDHISLRTVTVNIDAPQQIFDNSIKNGAYHYKEGSGSVYRNNLYQFVNAGYLNLNYKPNQKWDFLIGGRVENNINITRYKTQSQNVNDKFLTLTRNQYYILPSLSVKNSITNKSNIRFSASKTITRPILIEYMPIEYINPDNENIFGNKNLQNSENYNIDLKYELYPTSKELFALNLFGKYIDKAIERSFTASGNSNGQTITFFNADHAKIAGIELEGIISLKRISENLNKWTLGANTTIMYSDVKRSDEQKLQESKTQKTQKRTLQGAAPWIVNADLRYEFKNKLNLPQSLSLVYNVSGSKIFGVGTNSIDNIYERSFHQLDFVYKSDLTKNWNIKFGIMNILNSEYKLELGDKSDAKVSATTMTHTNLKRGTNFNLTLGYTF